MRPWMPSAVALALAIFLWSGLTLYRTRSPFKDVAATPVTDPCVTYTPPALLGDRFATAWTHGCSILTPVPGEYIMCPTPDATERTDGFGPNPFTHPCVTAAPP